MVLTLAIRTTMMISRNYLIMKTPGISFAMSSWGLVNAPVGSYFAVPEVGNASSPVSGYTPGIDVDPPPPPAVRIRGMRLFRWWMLLPGINCTGTFG